MSFEDDMIEDGFQDEQDYLDYLCEEAIMRQERMSNSAHDLDDSYEEPNHSTIDERARWGLMEKSPEGTFTPYYRISKRFLKNPLKAGHFVRGPHFDYIDMDNAIIIPDQYDQVDYFREGIARCHKGRRWVLINASCEELPLSEKESIGETLEWEGKRFYRVHRQSLSGCFQGGAQGLIDEKGNVLLPTIFNHILVNSGRLEVEYDRDIFSAPGKKTFSLEELLSIVNGPSGLLDWEKESWPEEIIPFVDGVRAIRRNNKWGFEKENGELLIDCQFTAVRRFQEYYDHYVDPWGKKNTLRSRVLAIVEKDWCSGCIDLAGKFVFHIRENVRLDSHKPKYPFFLKTDNKLWANYYNPHCGDIIEDAVADVQVDGSMLIRDGLDTLIIPAKYDWGYDSGDFIDVIKDGLWGIIDKNGNEIIPCKYEQLLFDYTLDDFANNRLLALKKNGKYGKVNNKGEEVVPFIYDDYDSLPQD